MNKTTSLFLACLLLTGGCATAQNGELEKSINHALQVARSQSIDMAKALEDQDERLPKTINGNGDLETCASSWWVSGFFPGVLWYLYEEFETDQLKDFAEEYTDRVEDQKRTTDNHDVGFMIFCSFGNGYRITKDKEYARVIKTACKSLSTRFDSRIGCIRSWDYAEWNKQWKYPVIIDNMMNLEMLMWGGREFHNKKFTDIAISHADTTLKNHFREDGSSFHVVSYESDGAVEKKNTSQGYSDDSAWARGQGWGLYGYTMMYRFTKDKKYLDQAVKIAEFITNHPRLPEDKIPYWDFDAPDIPDTLRDASAGALICSALLELSLYVDDAHSKKYMAVAEMQLKTLCSPGYLAEPGTNGHFILKHSVGHMPNRTEVDVPLTYADYYFMEALTRYKKIKGLK